MSPAKRGSFSRRLGIAVAAGAFALAPLVAVATEGTLYVSPERGRYVVGERFDMQIRVDTDGSTINAAEAELTFDPRDLAVESLSADGSILGSWPTEPAFSNTDGAIEFAGWTREPYVGRDGLLLTVTFRALRTNASNARFAAGAALSAGTSEANIITSMRSAAMTIAPEIVRLEPTPEPEPEPVASLQIDDAISEVLAAPSLIEYDREVSVGERIIVKGVAAPGARVLAWLALGDNEPERTELRAGIDGSFTFVSEDDAQQGVYRVWFETVAADGTRSDESRQLRIVATTDTVTRAAAATGALLIDAVPYVALVALAALALAYAAHHRNSRAL